MSKKKDEALEYLLWDRSNQLVHAVGTEEDVKAAQVKLLTQGGHGYDLHVVAVNA